MKKTHGDLATLSAGMVRNCILTGASACCMVLLALSRLGCDNLPGSAHKPLSWAALFASIVAFSASLVWNVRLVKSIKATDKAFELLAQLDLYDLAKRVNEGNNPIEALKSIRSTHNEARSDLEAKRDSTARLLPMYYHLQAAGWVFTFLSLLPF